MCKTNEEKINENTKMINEMLLDVCKSQRKMLVNMNHLLLALIVAFALTVMSCTAMFFKYESQFETKNITTVTETELTTEGENANINSVSNGNMYNDNAVHNQ